MIGIIYIWLWTVYKLIRTWQKHAHVQTCNAKYFDCIGCWNPYKSEVHYKARLIWKRNPHPRKKMIYSSDLKLLVDQADHIKNVLYIWSEWMKRLIKIMAIKSFIDGESSWWITRRSMWRGMQLFIFAASCCHLLLSRSDLPLTSESVVSDVLKSFLFHGINLCLQAAIYSWRTGKYLWLHHKIVLWTLLVCTTTLTP